MTSHQPLLDREIEAQEIVEHRIPWFDYMPGILLLIPMIGGFLLMFFDPDGMIDWAVSRSVLNAGRFENLQLHMFAHGSIAHIVMNGLALFSVAAVVVNKLGSNFKAWLGLLILFEITGLSGAATFLVLHQWNDVPMLGASGAIYGLVAFLVRIPANKDDEIIPIWSTSMWNVVINIIKDHFWLLLMFGLPPLLLGKEGGLAWEAHLGGFIAGLFLTPYLMNKGSKFAKR